MVHQFTPIRPIIIRDTYQGWDWHLERESYWEPRGRIIGAIVIGTVAAMSPSTTKTTLTKTTSTTSTGARRTENGRTMRSIAAVLLTETETRLTSTAPVLASN